MVILAACLSVIWLVAVVKLRAFWHNGRPELHHYYYGLVLYAASVWVEWLGWVGIVLMADDAMQHAIQLKYPSYRSPLHLLARYTVYR